MTREGLDKLAKVAEAKLQTEMASLAASERRRRELEAAMADCEAAAKAVEARPDTVFCGADLAAAAAAVNLQRAHAQRLRQEIELLRPEIATRRTRLKKALGRRDAIATLIDAQKKDAAARRRGAP